MFSLSMQILLLLAELGHAVVLLLRAVVPQDLAVVPQRRLSWWITVGFVLPLYKGCLLLRVDYLFHPQAPLLLNPPFSPDLSP